MQKKILLLLILLTIKTLAIAQSDLELLHNKKSTIQVFDHNHRSDDSKGLNNTNVLKTKKNSIIAQYNPFTLFFTGAMLLYQRAISPQISSSCAYQRSCSNFSKASIKEYGLLKGIFLSADRIMRCNTMVYQNTPADKLTKSGHIIDEPEKYKIKKNE